MEILLGYLLPFLGVMGALVFVHESGHFLAARALGIRVTHFSLGMGPVLFSRKDRRGTRWQLALLPLGGYVRMLGDPDDARSGEPVPEEFRNAPDREIFARRPLRHRAFVIAAGPLANLVLGVVLVTGLYVASGRPVTPPVIDRLVEGMPAAASELRPGDRVLSVDGAAAATFEDVMAAIAPNAEREIVVRVSRGADGARTEHAVRVTPVAVDAETIYGTRHRIGRIGIRGPEQVREELSPADAVVFGLSDIAAMTGKTARGVFEILTGRRPLSEVGGPVKVAEMSGRAAKHGLASLVFLMAALSVNLCVINLLPVPVLDGGHLLLYAGEAVRGKPTNPAVLEWIYRGGLAVVLVLFVTVTVKDVLDIWIRAASGAM